jgi:hypothetical protein
MAKNLFSLFLSLFSVFHSVEGLLIYTVLVFLAGGVMSQSPYLLFSFTCFVCLVMTVWKVCSRIRHRFLRAVLMLLSLVVIVFATVYGWTFNWQTQSLWFQAGISFIYCVVTVFAWRNLRRHTLKFREYYKIHEKKGGVSILKQLKAQRKEREAPSANENFFHCEFSERQDKETSSVFRFSFIYTNEDVISADPRESKESSFLTLTFFLLGVGVAFTTLWHLLHGFKLEDFESDCLALCFAAMFFFLSFRWGFLWIFLNRKTYELPVQLEFNPVQIEINSEGLDCQTRAYWKISCLENRDAGVYLEFSDLFFILVPERVFKSADEKSSFFQYLKDKRREK